MRESISPNKHTKKKKNKNTCTARTCSGHCLVKSKLQGQDMSWPYSPKKVWFILALKMKHIEQNLFDVFHSYPNCDHLDPDIEVPEPDGFYFHLSGFHFDLDIEVSDPGFNHFDPNIEVHEPDGFHFRSGDRICEEIIGILCRAEGWSVGW